MTTDQIIYLAIPYNERKEAFAAAGKLENGENALGFDKESKSWYAKVGADINKLKRWLPEQTQTAHNDIVTIEASFGAELRTAGFILENNPIMDGKWRRVPTLDDKGSQKSGAYRGFLDGKPAGIYQDHRNHSEPIKWIYQGNQNIDIERLANNRAAAAQQKIEREAKQKSSYKHHASRVNQALSLMYDANKDNSYLKRKQVIATEGLKEDKKGRLIIPLINENDEVYSIQRINSSGFKSLKKGAQKSGNFFRVGEPIQDGDTILYAEGYATAASIHMATNKTVFMTIDAGNMPTVAKKLAEKFPNSNHVFLADNDINNKVNKGLEKAKEAAFLTKGVVITPNFTSQELDEGNTDFNDLHVLHGLESVSKQLKEIEFMQPATTKKLDKEITEALEQEGIIDKSKHTLINEADEQYYEEFDMIAADLEYNEYEANDTLEDEQELEQANDALEDEQELEQANDALEDEQELEQASDVLEDEQEPKQASDVLEDEQEPKQASDELEEDGENLVSSTSNNNSNPFIIPEKVLDKYVEVEGKFYFERNPDSLAFVDKGSKIQTKLSNSTVASSMIDIAESRGWTEISVRGDKDFKRLAWLEAASRGLSVIGYKPVEADLAMLKKMTQGRQINEIVSTNQQDLDDQSTPLNPMAGKLVDHGEAPYKNIESNSKNYFVTLENSDGKQRTTWGKDLKRVMNDNNLKIGQQIELENLGRQEVTVTVPVKNELNKVIGFEKINTHRNEWAVKAEALRNQNKNLKDTAIEHPELINEIVAIKIAEKFSQNLPANQRVDFVNRIREQSAQNINNGVKASTIKVKEAQKTQERYYEEQAEH